MQHLFTRASVEPLSLPDAKERAELQTNGEEMAKVLRVAMRIANKKGIEVDSKFQEFVTQMRKGVSAEEVPFVRLNGIGRETCRSLQKFSKALKREHKIKSDDCLHIFQEYCQKESAEKLRNLLKDEVALIGEVRAKQVVELATKKEQQKTEAGDSEWF